MPPAKTQSKPTKAKPKNNIHGLSISLLNSTSSRFTNSQCLFYKYYKSFIT